MSKKRWKGGGELNLNWTPGLATNSIFPAVCIVGLPKFIKSKVTNSIGKIGPKVECILILSTVQPDYTVPPGL